MESRTAVRNALASALALGLVACGGGSGTRSDPPPTVPTTPPAPTTPQPAWDAHLALTNAGPAKEAGLTGKGYRIGVIDSGVMRNHPTLAGRVVANYNAVSSPPNNLAIDDVVGHGTTVAQLAAGNAAGSWPGGIAPGAEIVSVRIIADESPKDDGSGNGNEVTGALGMTGIHNQLIHDDVRIMNNSWGGLYWTRPTVTAQIAAEYRPFIIDHDGLVVFATGNESKPNPSDMAALPSQPGVNGRLEATDLERGWLAVAALDTAKPTQLASYSNACGVAKNYCLVAPGTVAFVGEESTADNLKYYYGSGTSYAAPLVSGAAAVVWEAFPYFNNDLVRQTLLGTATDLGEAGPDAVFGYGLLNIGKAIKGPAKFDWGDVVVDVSILGLGSVWSNDISGAGGLIKRGRGALTLSGENTYSGDTRIEQGNIFLDDGASIRSNVSINPVTWLSPPSLTFVRDSRVIGNVDNAGIVIVVGDSGTATIQGNYVQHAGGRIYTSLGANALHVTGTASLDGTLTLGNAISGYVPRDGVRQDLVRADGGLTGQFSEPVLVPINVGFSLLQADYGYDANTVWLDIDRISVTSAVGNATSARTMASAVRVEQVFEQLDGNIAGLSGSFGAAAAALQQVDGGVQGLHRSLDSLSGQAHAAATAMTFDTIDMSRRALSAQVAESRATSTAQSSWMRSLGNGGQGSYLGSDYNVGGWMMGSQTLLSGNAVLGVAFGQTHANSMVEASQGRSRDRQTQSQLYAGWSSGAAYVLGQAGVGQYQRELDRGLLLGSERAGVHTRYRGNFLTSSVEAGYRLGQGRAQLTPYLGADYSRVASDGFREQGGYGFGLRADDWSSTRVQALAGVRGQYLWKQVAFNGYAEWQQALGGNGLSLDASFVGVDAWAPIAGLQPSRSGGLFGLSVDSWLARNTRLSLGYDQRFGPRGDNRQVSLRLRQGF
ncbi:S8 family serine peptidase [Stenotrophomonas sp.]|uniref:S8 family serine peptidase n=1 Tax=Stenotrophomonas sp. TaxID=69392 RepID=UPI0028A613ED|nr:S8 family serine peptidase [Stenotrophomonas sp.]